MSERLGRRVQVTIDRPLVIPSSADGGLEVFMYESVCGFVPGFLASGR